MPSNALKKDIPPAPAHTSPLSAEKQGSVRQELVSCQYCFRSKAEGLTLSICTGCRIELYCVRQIRSFEFSFNLVNRTINSKSKECQKKAWPMHKPKCQFNQRNRHFINEDKMKRLRTFTRAHGPAIAEAGTRALEVGIRPENAQESILYLNVRERPATRPELSYYVTKAEVKPFEILGEEAAKEFREQLKRIIKHRTDRELDFSGVFFVALHDEEHGLTNISPTAYSDEVTYDEPVPWKEWMMEHMNGGILL
ncbi:hypothetical protein BDN72DRAFT_322946 [Pluteus cervinus]|uniref:Uncharacterized protein n=1 Tax=Pluteus cervinus TaxID=181527 RepID=A0ACD3AD18_9AGAR|nr:hypothetical protein BDN72DRAFT_322946 [Pluteus cervinus]